MESANFEREPATLKNGEHKSVGGECVTCEFCESQLESGLLRRRKTLGVLRHSIRAAGEAPLILKA